MKKQIDRKATGKVTAMHMLESGHCAQATLWAIQEMLTLDMPDALVLATAGLGGGIGHHGAVCGSVAGASLFLGFAATGREKEAEYETMARAGARVNDFVHRFLQKQGSMLCGELTDVDFENDHQVRKYMLTGFPVCLRVTQRATSLMVEILEAPQPGPDPHFFELSKRFFEEDFHCALSTVTMMNKGMAIPSQLPRRMLVPLNGGIGYCGSTCSALLGASLMIGLGHGGDTREGGKLGTLRRFGKTLWHGSAAFRDRTVAQEADAILRCSELGDWFLDRYGSHHCGEITGVDFLDKKQADSFFSGSGITRCRELAGETAGKAQELSV